mgnify:CR=1 FL=1
MIRLPLYDSTSESRVLRPPARHRFRNESKDPKMGYSKLLFPAILAGLVCVPASAEIQCRGLAAASDYSIGLVTSGGLATLFCTGLTGIDGVQSSKGFPLPYELAGIRVRVTGLDAPLLAVADFGMYQQINFQNPAETNDRSQFGSYALEVTQGEQRFESGPGRSSGPALFQDAKGYAIAQHASNYSLVTKEDPARPGEYIILYGTGVTNYSNVRNAPPLGMPAPFEPLAWTTAETDFARPIHGPFMRMVSPDLAGDNMSFSWVGLVPGAAGVFQMNFRMPAKVVSGSYWVIVGRAYEVIEALRVRIVYVDGMGARLYVSE